MEQYLFVWNTVDEQITCLKASHLHCFGVNLCEFEAVLVFYVLFLSLRTNMIVLHYGLTLYTQILPYIQDEYTKSYISEFIRQEKIYACDPRYLLE